jgi:hypothetical protein
LFLVNFAVNFVLYCVVNVQFRRTARDIVCCAWRSAGGHRSGRGSALGNGDDRGHRMRSGYEYSLGPSGVINGRRRHSPTSTVCSGIGSVSRYESVYMHPTGLAATICSTTPVSTSTAAADTPTTTNLGVVSEIETEM